MNVTLDYREIAEQVGADAENAARRIVLLLEGVALARIRQIAKDKLTIDQEKKYMEGVAVTRGDLSSTISVANQYADNLENGGPGFDMKPGILRGAKPGNDYVNVPFLHKTTKRGEGLMVPLENMKRMVRAAVSRVKRGGDNERLFTGSTEADRIRQSDMLIAHDTAPKMKGKVTARTYRRVSPNSSDEKWLYPKRDGLGIFEQVATELENVKYDLLGAFMPDETKVG